MILTFLLSLLRYPHSMKPFSLAAAIIAMDSTRVTRIGLNLISWMHKNVKYAAE